MFPDRIETRRGLLDERHADGTHAFFRHVAEGFEDAAGVGAIPFEEGEMEAEGVVKVDPEDLAAGAAEHGRGAGVGFREGGEGKS